MRSNILVGVRLCAAVPVILFCLAFVAGCLQPVSEEDPKISSQTDAGASVHADASMDTDAGTSIQADASVDTDAGASIHADASVDTDAGASIHADAGIPSGQVTQVVLQGDHLAMVAIDAKKEHVYVSNTSMNQIEDFSISQNMLLEPIAVGSMPQGFDITPDGLTMYVANSGANNISVVDLAGRRETHRITISSSGFFNDTPYSLAIAQNGKAFFSTTFAGSGFGGALRQLDLTTEVATLRTDFYMDGRTTEATQLSASLDHSAIAAVAGDISSGPVFFYRSATDAWTKEKDLDAFVGCVAVDSSASTILVDGEFVLDAQMNLAGTIGSSRSCGAFGNPPTAFRLHSDAFSSAPPLVQILDVSRFLVTGTVSLGDFLDGPAARSASMKGIAASSDSKIVAVIVPPGIRIVSR